MEVPGETLRLVPAHFAQPDQNATSLEELELSIRIEKHAAELLLEDVRRREAIVRRTRAGLLEAAKQAGIAATCLALDAMLLFGAA